MFFLPKEASSLEEFPLRTQRSHSAQTSLPDQIRFQSGRPRRDGSAASHYYPFIGRLPLLRSATLNSMSILHWLMPYGAVVQENEDTRRRNCDGDCGPQNGEPHGWANGELASFQQRLISLRQHGDTASDP
jgi:hypothetical protein